METMTYIPVIPVEGYAAYSIKVLPLMGNESEVVIKRFCTRTPYFVVTEDQDGDPFTDFYSLSSTGQLVWHCHEDPEELTDPSRNHYYLGIMIESRANEVIHELTGRIRDWRRSFNA